jgi:BASS family bile acid:Na+ symporter
MENAKHLIVLLVQASMFLLVMGVAMQCPWQEVLEQLRKPRRWVRAVIAVNVVVPAVAVLLTLLLKLPQPIAAGLILMAVSPLAPLVPGKALKVGADRAFVVASYLVLITLAIPIVPLSVMVIDAIFGTDATAPMGVIAKVVFLTALIPLGLGLLFSALAPALAARAAPILALVSKIVLALFVLLLLWMQGRAYLHMIGGGTILAFGLTVLAGVVAGHLLGDPKNRAALAVAASIRHPGIAFAIAHASGAGQPAQAAIILFLLNGVIVVTLYLAWLKRRHPAAAAEA